MDTRRRKPQPRLNTAIKDSTYIEDTRQVAHYMYERAEEDIVVQKSGLIEI